MNKMIFDETKNQYVLTDEDPVENPRAELEQVKALGGIAKLDVMGLPLGAVAAGTGLAFVVDRLIGERLATWGPVANLAVALGVKQFGTQYLGKGVADATAFVLTYEAIADTIQGWIESVWPVTPVEQGRHSRGVVAQAEQAARHATSQQTGYYDRILRR